MNTRLIFSLLCAAATLFAAEDMPKNLSAETFETTATREVELQYLLYLPADHKADQTRKWPLVLFLHGAGERGSNISRVAVHGPPKLVKNGTNFPFVLVAPQCPAGQIWSDSSLLRLLDDALQRYRIDESRVYLTGISMGGYGTWSLGLRNPRRFAAIAPICGGGDILPVLLPKPGNTAALKKLPVWAFHGARDQVVPLSESERMIDALKRAGNTNTKLTVYPEAGHDSWTQTYNQQEIYDWLLSHQR